MLITKCLYLSYNRFMIILLVIFFVLLLLSAALVFERSEFSLFELERRTSLGDKSAKKQLRHEELVGDIIALKHLVNGLLLIVITLVSIASFDWAFGVLIAILLTIVYIPISRLDILQSSSKKLYKYIEKPVVDFILKFPRVIEFLFGTARNKIITNLKINSREELQYLISESKDILSNEEKQLIINSLAFTSLAVSDVMTPRSMIMTIDKTEFLGPLMMDDLYKKSGHSYLPVVDEDVDHIIGVLNVKNLLSLRTKKSSTAEELMNKRICYIHQDQTLDYALSAFLKSNSRFFIVINEFRETVGIVSLIDVVEKMLGRQIGDDTDSYDDIHAIALRNPKDNNKQNKNRTDI